MSYEQLPLRLRRAYETIVATGNRVGIVFRDTGNHIAYANFLANEDEAWRNEVTSSRWMEWVDPLDCDLLLAWFRSEDEGPFMFRSFNRNGDKHLCAYVKKNYGAYALVTGTYRPYVPEDEAQHFGTRPKSAPDTNRP